MKIFGRKDKSHEPSPAAAASSRPAMSSQQAQTHAAATQVYKAVEGAGAATAKLADKRAGKVEAEARLQGLQGQLQVQQERAAAEGARVQALRTTHQAAQANVAKAKEQLATQKQAIAQGRADLDEQQAIIDDAKSMPSVEDKRALMKAKVAARMAEIEKQKNQKPES